MGARNRSLARMVDEIPNFYPPTPPSTPEPLLVLLDLKDRVSVCWVIPVFESS